MKNLFVPVLLLALAFSCNQGEKNSAESDATVDTEVAASMLTVGQVLESPEKYKDSEIKITGMVTHVCKHGGQKLFIVGDDPELQLRVNVGDGVPEFDMALEGSTVEFTGKVKILEEEIQAELELENEEKEHHTGEEAHAKAESASYFVEAKAFKEVTAEIE
jgi:RecJ-like exonuclease